MIPLRIFSQAEPLISQDIVKSPWVEDKTTSSWFKQEVQLRASINETTLTIQEKIRCPLAHPFRKAYKWAKRLTNKEFKFNDLSRVKCETLLNLEAKRLFNQLDKSGQSQILSKNNQQDLNSWEKEVVKQAISNGVKLYVEQPKDNRVWGTFHKAIDKVLTSLNGLFDKIGQELQKPEADLEAPLDQNINLEWESLVTLMNTLSSSDISKDVADYLKKTIEKTIFSLAQSEFKDHKSEKDILAQLELHLKGDALNRFLENSQQHLASIENETEVGKEVKSFIQKIIEKEKNAKSPEELMNLLFGRSVS